MLLSKPLPLLALLVLGFLALGQTDPALTIRPSSDAKHIEVKAFLPADLAQKLPGGRLTQDQGEKLLQVLLLNQGTEGPPILGIYERQDRLLLFHPRFPLEPGELYRARLTLPGNKITTTDYRVPALPKMPPAVVEKIYPTSDVVPANHLKFYIYFSRPMRGGKDIFDQIQILDEKGEPVFDPWLHDELWSADGLMLILYIHPGRIKWGVLLRELLGPVLLPNREYTLVLNGDMLDDRGQKLGKNYTKRFRTTAEDRTFVNVADWKITSPKANTRQPLTVQFTKILDHKSLGRFLTVFGPHGKTVAGKAIVGPQEKSWAFHPEQPWQAAEYTLSVHPRLEDAAGNTPLRPFDLDLQAPLLPKQKLDRSFQPLAH